MSEREWIDPYTLVTLQVKDNHEKMVREYIDGPSGEVLAWIDLAIIQRDPMAEQAFLRQAFFP